MKVYAPGKLILSGEHAVVYGQPALAMAVDRYASATVTKELLPQISFHLADIAHRSRLSISKLHLLKERIKRKYHRFIRGEYTIKQVLHKPFELAHFALGVLAEALNVSLPHGVNIHVQSDIPIGCGMGSSAATILCVMHAVSNYLDVPLTSEMLYQLALEAENMQHGKSSGLDLRVAMQGGCVYMRGNEFSARDIPGLTMYLINTGTPESTTGQCVEFVMPHFQSQTLCDEFGMVTNALDIALQQNAFIAAQQAIHANHRLLDTIGVVPERVNQFIHATELINGAAKICGAGAISGEKAGVVLALVPDKVKLEALCKQFHYDLLPIAGVERGVYAV